MDSPEEWLVLEIRLPEDGAQRAGPGRSAIARALLDLGGRAVREEGRMLRTWVPVPEDLEAFLDRVQDRMGARGKGEGLQLRWRRARDRDWARRWREGLGPRRVGRRLVVAPSWSEVAPGPGQVLVRVDPGMAFGTGEHGTTRGALRLLEDALAPGDRVLDVGAGSGILSVAAVRLGARFAVGIETDPDAVRTARENARRNGVSDRIRILRMEAAGPRLRLLAPPRFDLVAANILVPVLRRLLPAFRHVLADDGRLILGGILRDERDEMVARSRGDGWTLEAEDRDGEWWTGRFRPRPGGEPARG